MDKQPASTPVPPTPAEQPPVAAVDPNQKALEYLIPINRSGWAIAAGYVALFNFLFITLPVTGTLSVFFAVMGLRDINKHPGRKGKGRCWFAIISTAVIAVLIGILFLTGSGTD